METTEKRKALFVTPEAFTAFKEIATKEKRTYSQQLLVMCEAYNKVRE